MLGKLEFFSCKVFCIPEVLLNHIVVLVIFLDIISDGDVNLAATLIFRVNVILRFQ